MVNLTENNKYGQVLLSKVPGFIVGNRLKYTTFPILSFPSQLKKITFFTIFSYSLLGHLTQEIVPVPPTVHLSKFCNFLGLLGHLRAHLQQWMLFSYSP